MTPEKVSETLGEFVGQFRSTYKVLHEADWENIGGRDLDGGRRVDGLSLILLAPAVASLQRVAEQDDDWLRAQGWATLARLVEAVNELNKARKALLLYVGSPADGSHGNQWEQLRDAVAGKVRAAQERVEPLLLRLDATEAARASQAAREAVKELVTLRELIDRDVVSLGEKTNAIIVDAERALATVREAAASQGIAREVVHFVNVGKRHRLAVIASLAATAILAGGLLLWIIATIEHPRHAPPFPAQAWFVAGNLSYFGSRFLGVSVISFLLVVSVRSFRASRHNQITNAHRAGALVTFRELRDAAAGPVADAILLQATDAIFRPQPTGFGDESVGAPNHVAEMMKMFRQESKSAKGE